MPEDAARKTPGWTVLHRFERINRTRWQALSVEKRSAATEEMDDHTTSSTAEVVTLQYYQVEFFGDCQQITCLE